MAQKYHVTAGMRAFNGVMKGMSRLGLGPSSVLTTTGWRSGERRSVPVSPIEIDGAEHIVSPYGTVGWVRNIQVDNSATIQRGGSTREVRLVEVTDPGRKAKVLVVYHAREPFARRYMDVPEDPGVEDFMAKASRFHVFEVR